MAQDREDLFDSRGRVEASVLPEIKARDTVKGKRGLRARISKALEATGVAHQ